LLESLINVGEVDDLVRFLFVDAFQLLQAHAHLESVADVIDILKDVLQFVR